jgi:hypothetical protein
VKVVDVSLLAVEALVHGIAHAAGPGQGDDGYYGNGDDGADQNEY